MNSLAETFLQDINDLSDDTVTDFHHLEDFNTIWKNNHQKNKTQSDTLNDGEIRQICRLTTSNHYKHIIKTVETLSNSYTDDCFQPTKEENLEHISSYTLLGDCNKLTFEIENEISLVHNFNRDQYRPRFPELESLVQDPLDYARVILAIGSEENISQVNLDHVLPSSNIMVVTVTASTTNGKPLPDDKLNKVLEGSAVVLQLYNDKEKILSLIERKMNRIAPNLSIVLGFAIAAKLIGLAGGLICLSKIPASIIQVLGSKRKNSDQSSINSFQQRKGFVFSCDIIQKTPFPWRDKALKIISSKCALLSRVDAYGQDPVGSLGRSIRNEIVKKIEKYQEPSTVKTNIALPVPDGAKKNRRSGKRHRKNQERDHLNIAHNATNRISFNRQEELDDGDKLIGKDKMSSVIKRICKRNHKISKATQKRIHAFSSTREVPGLSSPLTFTPVQGIELSSVVVNNSADTCKGTQTYFNNFLSFKDKKVI
jgi:U4/U6 small nuclear ribonucleoprotein PRP31